MVAIVYDTPLEPFKLLTKYDNILYITVMLTVVCFMKCHDPTRHQATGVGKYSPLGRRLLFILFR